MNEEVISLKQMLVGENAFYNRADYEDVTRLEMASSKPLDLPIYTYNTDSKAYRVAKDIFSVVIFPICLYQLTHSLAGKLLVPASTAKLTPYGPGHADRSRNEIKLNSKWKVKRFTVEVDGFKVDAAIMGKPSTLGNGRWVLLSHGNGQFYEDGLQDRSFKNLLTELDGNALVFNYPGVGSSLIKPNRSKMIKAYLAMINLLEDQEKGIGAEEFIGYGHSIGAGVQGEALLLHKLNKDIKYVFVKSRAFSDLRTAATYKANRFFGFLVSALGWNISSVESSKKLKAPEIIMQTANVSDYCDISEQPETILHDGMIPMEATLAKKLLDDIDDEKQQLLTNKYFMGIPERHNSRLKDPTHLANKIKEMLNASNSTFAF